MLKKLFMLIGLIWLVKKLRGANKGDAASE